MVSKLIFSYNVASHAESELPLVRAQHFPLLGWGGGRGLADPLSPWAPALAVLPLRKVPPKRPLALEPFATRSS